MRYTRISTQLFAGLLALSALSACSKDDNVFSAEPQARISQFNSDVQQILRAAPNGWSGYIYPSESEKWGGYLVTLKFIDDRICEASNDLLNDPTRGEYTISNGVLSFTTYSRGIHIFSEPNPANAFEGDDATEHTALGADGDYSYQILSATPERIVLRGERSKRTLELTPIAAGTSAQTLTAESRTTAQRLDFPYIRLSVGDSSYVGGAIDLNNRQLAFTAKGQSHSLPFAITTGGIHLSSPFTLDGVTFQDLSLRQVGEDYELASENGNVTIAVAERAPIEFLQSQSWRFGARLSGRAQRGFEYGRILTQNRWDWATVPFLLFQLQPGGNVAQITLPIFDASDGALAFRGTIPATYTVTGNDEFSILAQPIVPTNNSEVSVFQRAMQHIYAAGLLNSRISVGSAVLFNDDTTKPRNFRIVLNDKRRPRYIQLIDKDDPTNVIYLYQREADLPQQ